MVGSVALGIILLAYGTMSKSVKIKELVSSNRT